MTELPPPPQIVPEDLARFSVDNTVSDWTNRVPPAAVGMFIATVAQWLSAPRMGCKVTIDTLPDGWTFTVQIAPPDDRDDVTVP